jgi:C-terminal, D2-small domain, of ClpB protein
VALRRCRRSSRASGFTSTPSSSSPIDLAVSDEAFEFLVRRGIHEALDARPLKKAVQKFIGDAIRDAMKAGAQSSGVLAVCSLNALYNSPAISKANVDSTSHGLVGTSTPWAALRSGYPFGCGRHGELKDGTPG